MQTIISNVFLIIGALVLFGVVVAYLVLERKAVREIQENGIMGFLAVLLVGFWATIYGFVFSGVGLSILIVGLIIRWL